MPAQPFYASLNTLSFQLDFWFVSWLFFSHANSIRHLWPIGSNCCVVVILIFRWEKNTYGVNARGLESKCALEFNAAKSNINRNEGAWKDKMAPAEGQCQKKKETNLCFHYLVNTRINFQNKLVRLLVEAVSKYGRRLKSGQHQLPEFSEWLSAEDEANTFLNASGLPKKQQRRGKLC